MTGPWGTGRAAAKLLHSWLPSVLQAIKPFFSPDDIAKGARWSSEVAAEIEASQVGLIIVTRESLSAPWIMFEAGALSRNVGSTRVAPILVDVESTALLGPLLQFQSARLDAQDMKRVVRMLNSELKDQALADDVLESTFSIWWSTLESQVEELVSRRTDSVKPRLHSDRELIEEILDLTRAIVQRQAGLQPLPWRVLFSGESGALTRASVIQRMSSGGNLAGANLMELNLAQVDLSGANLRGASLVRASMRNAKLISTNLHGANLEGAIRTGRTYEVPLFLAPICGELRCMGC